MPELPDVEALRIEMKRRIHGRTIADVHAVNDRRVLEVNPQRFTQQLKGRRVDDVARKGKFIWWVMDRGPCPIFHFAMTGETIYGDANAREPKYTKAAFRFRGNLSVFVLSRRRLGRIALKDDPPGEPPISELGPDALYQLPGSDELEAMLARRSAAIKTVFMDQGFLSGVGNITADEILYQSGIDPHRPANALSHDEIVTMREKIRYIMTKTIERNLKNKLPPTSWLFRHRDPDGGTLDGHRIENGEVGGRATYWVPAEQR
jgi:formamidopyrimidine-DNA glycosylase